MAENEEELSSDEPAESGALEPEGEGERRPAPPQEEPAESGALEGDEDEP